MSERHGRRGDSLLPGLFVPFNCCLGCLSSGLTLFGRAMGGMDDERGRER